MLSSFRVRPAANSAAAGHAAGLRRLSRATVALRSAVTRRGAGYGTGIDSGRWGVIIRGGGSTVAVKRAAPGGRSPARERHGSPPVRTLITSVKLGFPVVTALGGGPGRLARRGSRSLVRAFAYDVLGSPGQVGDVSQAREVAVLQCVADVG